MRLIFIPEKLSEVHCVTAREARSLPKRSQIGFRCSGTKKCSQRFEMDHFCPGNISAIRTAKFFFNPMSEPSVSIPQYPIYL